MTSGFRQSRSARDANPAGRRLVVLSLAFALQLPVFLAFVAQTQGGGTYVCDPLFGRIFERDPASMTSGLFFAAYHQRCTRVDNTTRLTGVPMPLQKKDKPDPEVNELPPDVQIVEVPEQEEPDKLDPIKTKHVSNRNARTERETKSARSLRSQTQAPGDVAVDKPSPVRSERSKSPDPTVTSKEQTELKLADAVTKLPDADSGQKRPDSMMERGKDTSILLPSTSKKAALANIQALSGDFTTTDYLPDIAQDKSTVLNANKYRYADFFIRVKKAVERHWHPAQLYRRRDPTGKAYGVKDRYTLLRVTLDDDGKLVRLLTTRNSGLDFMDSEAKQAFERAQPFPNPPDGLLNPKNEVVFEFGFYFEITAGRHRFRWRRL